MLVSLSVCLYPINVKTAKPNLIWDLTRTPRKVYGWAELKKIHLHNIYNFVKFQKSKKKNPGSFCYCFIMLEESLVDKMNIWFNFLLPNFLVAPPFPPCMRASSSTSASLAARVCCRRFTWSISVLRIHFISGEYIFFISLLRIKKNEKNGFMMSNFSLYPSVLNI